MPVNNNSRGLSSKAKIQLVGLLVLFGLFGGMMGFMSLEEMGPLEALYMTVITLSTVGFREVRPLHPEGQVFVILLITYGVFLAGSVATLVGEHILAGHFRDLVRRRKMETRLKKISDHFVIAGFGRVGRQVAREFAVKKVNSVIIEKDPEDEEKIIAAGHLLINGDATDDEVLLKARLDKAHTLISTLPEETLNVYLTLTARHLNAKLNIIARADFEDGEKKLMRAGADHVVIPHVLGGIRMAKAALQPNVVDFMQMASLGEEGLFVEEMVIPVGSTIAGKTLAESELNQKYGVTIIGVKKTDQKMNINPTSSTVLDSGDVIVLVGDAGNLESLSKDIAPER